MQWTPSIAPSGMAFYTGEAFPQWQGNLFVGALKFRLLARLVLEDGKVVHEERLLTDFGRRIRDVRQGPDGHLWLLEESEGSLLRLESVQNAVDQAKCLAKRLIGRPERYAALPWFWSDQGPYKLQIAGLSTGYDQVVVRGEPADEKFAVLYYRSGRLIAADCVNRPVDFMAIRQALGKGQTVAPEAATDADTPIKKLVTDVAPAVV